MMRDPLGLAIALILGVVAPAYAATISLSIDHKNVLGFAQHGRREGHIFTAAAREDWVRDVNDCRLNIFVPVYSSKLEGVFKEYKLDINLDPVHVEQTKMDVDVDIGSIDMHNPVIDLVVQGEDWLNAKSFPHAKFYLTEIKSVKINHFVASGWLSLKGVKRPTVIPFSWIETGNKRVVQGRLTIPRDSFGIGPGAGDSTSMWSSVIGNDVALEFKLTFHQAGR